MFVHIFFDPQSSKGVAPLVFWADFWCFPLSPLQASEQERWGNPYESM